ERQNGGHGLVPEIGHVTANYFAKYNDATQAWGGAGLTVLILGKNGPGAHVAGAVVAEHEHRGTDEGRPDRPVTGEGTVQAGEAGVVQEIGVHVEAAEVAPDDFDGPVERQPFGAGRAAVREPGAIGVFVARKPGGDPAGMGV